MYDIINIEQLTQAVKTKSDFELAREFVFWDTKDSFKDLKLIAQELFKRRRQFSIMIFFFVALLTNTLMFFAEVQLSHRWLYFEDRPKQIVRQYVAGFIYLSFFPILVGLDCLLTKGTINGLIETAIIVFGIALLIGISKTIYDIINFVLLTR